MITDEKLRAIREALVEAIEATSPLGLMGAKAGIVVHGADPTYAAVSYGYRNLREFILGVFSDFKIVAETSDDVYYGLSSWPERTAALGAEGPSSADLWQTWVSPSAPTILVINTATGALRTASKTTPPGSDELLVPQPDHERHAVLAAQFQETLELSEDQLESLKVLIVPEVHGWWSTWFDHLKAIVPQYAYGWWRYRTTHLQEDFESVLADQGLAEEMVAEALRELQRSEQIRAMASRAAKKKAASPAESRRLLEPSSSAPTSMARVVESVIAEMSEDQLRRLNLPVGLVLDAILRHK